MEIFINETSLHGQYANQYTFLESFKIFLSAIKRIGEIKNDKKTFNSNYLFYYCAIEGEVIQSTIKSIPSLNQAFVQNLQILNPSSWQNDQKHDVSCSYSYRDENLVNTTVAEISERSLISDSYSGFVLNFSDSKFGTGTTFQILKDESTAIDVDSVTSQDEVENWLISRGYLNPSEIYDESLGIPPADYQTVLKDSNIFERTNYPRNNGRIVYRRKGTNELWTVDSAMKHAGAKAHIEVFDENSRKHLGTSLYNQININSKFKVDTRTINLG